MTATASLVFVRVAAQVLQFGLFLAAARILSTSEFGIFSLTFAIVAGLTVLAEAGWREYAICCEPREDVVHVTTLASLSGTAIALVALVICASCWELGIARHLVPTGAVLTLWIWLRPATVAQVGLLTRDGRLGAVALVQFLSELAGFAAGLAALLLGTGVLSLAIGKIALQVVETIGTLLFTRSFALARPDRVAYRDALLFSRRILNARILGFLQGNFSTMIVGAAHSTAEVGFYRAAVRVVGAAQETIREPARHSSWSYLRGAHQRDACAANGEAIAQAAVRYCEILLALAAPIFVTLAVMAPQVTALLLGPSWSRAAPLISILSVATYARLLSSVIEPLFGLKGRVELVQRYTLVATLLSMTLLTLAVPFGLLAVAWSELVAAVVSVPIALRLLNREAGIAPGAIGRALAPILAGAAACLMATLLLHFSPADDKLLLFLQLAGVTCVAFGCHFLVILFGNLLLQRNARGVAQ